MNRSDSFPALCARVRATILFKYGANASKPFLLVLDLMEILARDTLPAEKLVDAAKEEEEKPT